MKSIYKKAVSNIKADAMLIEKTKQKMKESEQSPDPFSKHKNRRKFQIGGLVAAAVLLVFLVAPIFQEKKETHIVKNIASVQIEAVDKNDDTIAVDTEFIIKTKDTGLTKEDLKTFLKVTPEIPFALEKKGSNEYVLTLQESLKADEIVNVSLMNEAGTVQRKWAFQTENTLKVSQTIPGQTETYVPIQTGIEITLSTPSVSLEDFQKSISISPEVAGKWKKNRNVFTFIPDATLKPETVYQVVLDKGLKTADGQTFPEGYELAFETSVADGETFYTTFDNASKISETFLPDDPKVISIIASESFKTHATLFDVKIFQYPDAAAYKADLLQYSTILNTSVGRFKTPTVSTEKLMKISELKTALQFEEQAEYIPSYILLPNDMKQGWYYVEVTGKDPNNGRQVTLNKWIQVSDISVYQMKVANESLFWLHDTNTGKTIANADVTLQGTSFQSSGQTNSEGVAQIKLADEEKVLERHGVVDIRVGKQSFIDLFQVGMENYHNDSSQYYSYLYTDRPVYLSTDTVEVWGIVKPRNQKEKLPSKLMLVLGEKGNPVGQTEVKLNKNGMFSGEISFENLGANGYEILYLQDESGKAYGETGIEILDYVKPIYQLAVNQKNPITLYPTENPIEADLQMSFYDGTAVLQTDMQLSYYDENGELRIPFQTDDKGAAEVSFRVKNSKNTWRPQWINYNIQTAGAENVPLYKEVASYVVYRDIAIEGDYDDKQNTLEITSHRIDLSKVKSFEDITDENVLGAAYSGKVTAEIHKTYVEKIANGTYYDFIQKKNVTKYDYVQRDEIVRTENISLQNGKGILKDLPEGKGDVSYYVLLKINDTKGNLVEEKVWYAAPFRSYYSSFKAYYFNKENNKNDEDMYHFSDQEDLTFTVRENNTAVPKGQVVAVVVQNGISEVFAVDIPKVEVPFTEERVPNYVLAGAYFDGKHVYSISEHYMSFSPENRELRVEVQANQTQYAPGEKASVEVKITNAKTGKAVSNAEVSLSVVDEALFGVAEQTVDPLHDLYRSAFFPSIQNETSYIEHNLLDTGGAEKGSGDGGVGVRKDFVDTAAFLTGQTNGSGIVKFTIDLPDNLTTWRLTTQAVTPDLYAGYVKENIQVTQDFFVHSIALNTFIVGDDIHIPLRAAGNQITGDELVQYTVTLQGGEQSKTIEAKGAAHTLTSVQVGQLPEGVYTLMVHGKSANYEDKVETQFRVVNDVISTYQLQDVDLVKKNIKPTKFPVMIEVSRAEDRMYLNTLQYLNRQQGNRSDERMARAYAEQKFVGETEGIQLEAFADVVSRFGEVSLFPYSDIDWALTAKVQQANLPWIPSSYRNGSYAYTLTNSKSTSSEIAIALYGLAVNKQPVLNYILDALNNPEGFSHVDQLYLLAGLTAIGDETNAQAFYNQLVSSKVSNGTNYAFVKVGKTEEDYLQATAIASLTASVLHTKEADLFIQYLMDTSSKTELYLMEMLVYLQNYQAEQLEPVMFQVETTQKKENITLKPLETKLLTLYQKDWEALRVSIEKGELLANARLVTNESGLNRTDEKFSLNRKIEVVGGGDLAVGKKVKITLTPTITDQTYSRMFAITDYLPSGFRYIGTDNSNEEKWRWYEGRREGQRILFGYFADWMKYEDEADGKLRKTENPESLVYYALCVAPGTYTQVPALFTERSGKQWGQSDKEQVVIK